MRMQELVLPEVAVWNTGFRKVLGICLLRDHPKAYTGHIALTLTTAHYPYGD